jgi:methylmalonyl-CoA epimerase
VEIVRVDHIGIAVRDIEASQRFYSEVLGLEVGARKETADLKIAFIHAGETEVELLQPTGTGGAVAKFLETRGEGIHHLAFAVTDIEAALTRAKAAGYALIDEKPRPGAGAPKIAFLHPKTLGGVLVEFCEHDQD